MFIKQVPSLSGAQDYFSRDGTIALENRVAPQVQWLITVCPRENRIKMPWFKKGTLAIDFSKRGVKWKLRKNALTWYKIHYYAHRILTENWAWKKALFLDSTYWPQLTIDTHVWYRKRNFKILAIEYKTFCDALKTRAVRAAQSSLTNFVQFFLKRTLQLQ